MSVLKSLIKVHLEGKCDAFLMSEYEVDKKLSLKILNFRYNEAYVGQCDFCELRLKADARRFKFDAFIEKLKGALFHSVSDGASNGLKYSYHLDNKDGSYIFNWNLIDEEESVFNCGTLEMEKIDHVLVFTDVLQSVSEEMQKLYALVQNFKMELSNSKSQLSDALQKLSLANDIKETVEKELYSKFVLVLNEKKRKITELKQNTNSTSREVNNNKGKKKKMEHVNSVISSENSNSSDAMDLHKVTNKGKKKKVECVISSESNSSDAMDAILDFHKPGPSSGAKRDSLSFFDENKSIAPVTKSRIRNRKARISKSRDVADHSPNSMSVTCDKDLISKTDGGNESADSLLDFL